MIEIIGSPLLLMFLPYVEHALVGNHNCNLLLLYPPHNLNMLLFLKQLKRLFGLKV